MNKKSYLIGGAILAIILAYATGRYAKPDKIVTKTVTVEVEKTRINENKVIVEKINKDGTKTTTTHVITKTETDTKIQSKNDSVVQNNKSPLNVSLLAGYDFNNVNLVYGVHVSKQLLGPVSIGIFGLTNKTIGMSAGLQF